MGRDTGDGGIGTRQERHQALVGDALEVSGKASNVMTAADDDGAGAVNFGASDGEIEGPHDEPRPGKALAVPRNRSGPIGDDAGLAGLCHRAFFELGEVRREEGEAVRGVAEEVALGENLGDDGRFVGVESGASEERGGVGDECGG